MSALISSLLQHPEFREGVEWRRHHVAVNETIFTEGDRGREIYLIVSGRVRIIGNVDLEGQRRLRPGFSELGPGEVFGELALFDGEPRSAAVVASVDTELVMIDGERLIAFLDDHPQIGYPLFKELNGILVQRLRAANQRIFSLFAWGLKARGIDQHL